LYAQGLSVRQLALRACVPLSAVQRICAGEGRQPSVWTLVQLADVLGVSLDYLVGRTDAPAPSPPPLSPQVVSCWRGAMCLAAKRQPAWLPRHSSAQRTRADRKFTWPLGATPPALR